jgi:flavin-dependent dehydrogenase
MGYRTTPAEPRHGIPHGGPAPIGQHRHDVVVVGARAAGAATALLLARLGHDVVVVDRATFPSDTLSTHQVARPGVVQLQRWGLLQPVLDSGAPPIREVTFSAGGETITREIKERSGVDILVAPRRYLLDTIVADAAANAGAQLRFGITAEGVCLDDTGRAIGVYGHDDTGAPIEIHARFVVGADGLSSRVARSVGAEMVERRGDTGGVTYAYFGGVPWGGIELYAAERALAGVFPTHHGEACVWVTAPSVDARAARRRARTRTQALIAQIARAAPELAARLAGGEQASPVSGMLHMPNQIRQAYGRGWALVGDAGYHRDAVTGHGLSDAYRDAELLAVALHHVLTDRAAEGEALSAYAAEREQGLREVFEITCALAAYPSVPEFVELQKQLSRALDCEAADLAARTLPDELQLARG